MQGRTGKGGVYQKPGDAEAWFFSHRQVVALTLLTANGTILECSESSNAEVFQAARVHLGCLGVILTVTLQCVPQFHLQETTFPSPLKEVLSLICHCSASEKKWRTLIGHAPLSSAGPQNGTVS